ncbi:MAG: hypothetical protein ABRQ38_13775 [Candidatus Eremiobacterota bacterium]
MKLLVTCLLIISIIFSLAYFTCTVAQERPCGPKHNGYDDMPSVPPNLPEGRNCVAPELTDVQIQELVNFCKEYFPTFYKSLEELKNSNPLMYKKVTGEKFILMLHLKELKKEELFKVITGKIELEDKSRELTRKYKEHEGNDTAQAAIEQELEKILAHIFALRQKENQLQVEKMEKEIKHLKEIISVREKNKNIIIKDGVNKLTGKSEYLEW